MPRPALPAPTPGGIPASASVPRPRPEPHRARVRWATTTAPLLPRNAVLCCFSTVGTTPTGHRKRAPAAALRPGEPERQMARCVPRGVLDLRRRRTVVRRVKLHTRRDHPSHCTFARAMRRHPRPLRAVSSQVLDEDPARPAGGPVLTPAGSGGKLAATAGLAQRDNQESRTCPHTHCQ